MRRIRSNTYKQRDSSPTDMQPPRCHERSREGGLTETLPSCNTHPGAFITLSGGGGGGGGGEAGEIRFSAVPSPPYIRH